MVWPDDFPAACPPSDASAATGVVFRLVRSAPPSPKDFEAHWDLYPNLRPEFGDPCQARGLSVYRTLRDAIALKERLAKRVKAKKKKVYLVAQGTLQPDMGVTKLTKGEDPTHTTWWKPKSCDPCPFFTVVEPGGGP